MTSLDVQHVLALALIVVSLAGCLGGGDVASPTRPPLSDSPANTPPQATTSPETAPPGTEPPDAPEWSPPADPFETIVIGNATDGEELPESHAYTIWNHVNETRTIRVRIVRNDTTVHAHRHEFPARGTIEITLADPATYAITVSAVGSNRSRTFTDPIQSFDCNRKSVHVTVLEDGRIHHRSVRTLIACRSVTDGRT